MLFEKENTEEKIIRATFNILQREGLQKTTTKKIAAEAEVNEVTVFRKFENKKNLIEATKNFYMEILLKKLEETFVFNEEDEIEDYLNGSFNKILNLTEEDFSIIKVAMREVEDGSDKKLLITQITDVILNKLEEFFKLQVEKGNIKEINPMSVALLCYSVMFQSLVLLQIYGDSESEESKNYSKDFKEIIFNGIKP